MQAVTGAPPAPVLDIGLNPQQLHAVTRGPGAVIVLAGPGSGKTRVIVNRAMFLHHHNKIPARHITAVTFTNKAAMEMKERLASVGLSGVSVLTFHRLCLRLLRRFGGAVGVPPGFTVADRSDQLALIAGILRGLGAAGHAVAKEDVIEFASALKNRARWPCAPEASIPVTNTADGFAETSEPTVAASVASTTPSLQFMLEPDDATLSALRLQYCVTFSTLLTAYKQYQCMLAQSCKLDFDDLLVLGVRLVEACPVIAEVISSNCHHLLVDEFQDTNTLQYRLVRGVTRRHGNVFVVGDPYQCIYTWRFASPDNLNKIASDYRCWEVVMLDQNYRSSPSILAVANAVISSGAAAPCAVVCGDPSAPSPETVTADIVGTSLSHRKLWTTSTIEVPVTCCLFGSDETEALYIANELSHALKETSPTGRHCSAAVLYRTGAVAKLVEKALIRAGISYRVTGGTRLFDHQEIKDIVAYLQVALNPGDALAFKRAVGTPRRGIGPQTISALEAHATARKLPIFTVCQRVVQGEGVKGVSPAAVKALGPFTHAILTLKMASNDPAVPLSDAVQRMLTSLKFPEYLQREFGVDASNRMAHVAELLACIKSFDGDASAVEAANEDDPVSAKPSQRLAHLLQHMALVSDVDALHKGGSGGSVVTLSTVHAAKGMEWDTVFVLGVETNLFPHARSVVADDVDKPATSSSSFKEDPVDEERRLLYVAVTRARRNLYITRALRRCLNGRTLSNGPCPFLATLPAECVHAHISDDAVAATTEGVHPDEIASGLLAEDETNDPGAAVDAPVLIGQHKPVTHLQKVDCTVNPGQHFGVCDPSFGVVKPAHSSGVVPVGAVGFRVAKEVYAAGSISEDAVGIMPQSQRKPAKKAADKPAKLTSYFRPSTPPVQKSVSPVGGLTCFDTPFGMVTHPTGRVALSNGHVIIKNATTLSCGVPNQAPSIETKAAKVVTASATESVVSNAGKRLGVRFGVSVDAALPSTTDYASPTLSTATSSTGAPFLRKPFKKPRLLGANSV